MASSVTIAPSLTSRSIPTNSDVRSGNQLAIVSAGTSDVGLGVRQVYARLDHSFQSHGGLSIYPTIYDFTEHS
jgi:hypothetical protein